MRRWKTESPQAYPSDLPTIEFYQMADPTEGSILLDAEDRNGYWIRVNFLTGVVAVEKV